MNTLKYECNLQNNLYFHWMQLINAISSNWKIIIKQNNDSNAFTTSEHYFVQSSGVLTIQKITLKDLYWILIITMELKPTSHKNTLKKNCLI